MRQVRSAVSVRVFAASVPGLSSPSSRSLRWTALRTVSSGAFLAAWASLEGGRFLSASSKKRRVVTLPFSLSTTRFLTLTVFLGIFASAFSSLTAALSALRTARSSSGSARSSSVKISLGERFAIFITSILWGLDRHTHAAKTACSLASLPSATSRGSQTRIFSAIFRKCAFPAGVTRVYSLFVPLGR